MTKIVTMISDKDKRILSKIKRIFDKHETDKNKFYAKMKVVKK